jgi:hypothetical protein
MKRILLLLAVLSSASAKEYERREGDFVFQSFPHNELTDVIEGCTHSGFSHCGIVHLSGSKWVVIEAVGPVQETPMDDWVNRGRGHHIAVYRLKQPWSGKIPEMIKNAKSYLGRPYDIHMRFDDEKLYCSELLFKAFKKSTNQDLGKTQEINELDWKPWETAIEHIEGGPVPLDRRLITPKAITESEKVELVFSDFDPKAKD